MTGEPSAIHKVCRALRRSYIFRRTAPAGLGEAHERAALVQLEPALLDGALDPGAVQLGRSARSQKRQVDSLDEDAAILYRLDGARDVDELARSDIGIGESAVGDELNASPFRAGSERSVCRRRVSRCRDSPRWLAVTAAKAADETTSSCRHLYQEPPKISAVEQFGGVVFGG